MNCMANDAPEQVTKEDIIRALELHKDEPTSRFKVKQIGIFGSYARGEQNVRSDIDLLVEFFAQKPIFLNSAG